MDVIRGQTKAWGGHAGRAVFGSILLSSVMSCALQPPYQRPEVSVPDSYRSELNGTTTGTIDETWWTAFADPILNELEAAGLEHNLDIAIARSRAEEARVDLRAAGALIFPTVQFGPSATRARTSSTVVNAFPVPNSTLYVLPVTASYEPDLWGEVRGQVKQAQDEVESQNDSTGFVRLTVAGDIAAAYFQVRAQDRQLDVLKHTLGLRKEALDLVIGRFNIGVTTELDVEQARADFATTEAEILDVRRARELDLDALAILIARNPSKFTLEPRANDAAAPLPVVPAGLPSRLLQSRPDVAASERMLAAAYEQVGVARADRFPSLALTASGGVASYSLRHLGDAGSPFWSIGSALLADVFDGGAKAARVDGAQARLQVQTAAYHRSTLVAFREVEDALANRAFLVARAAKLSEATVASQRAAELTRSRYLRGITTYFEVVNSDRITLSNQRIEIENQVAEQLAVVSLFKALGGGWSALPDVNY